MAMHANNVFVLKLSHHELYRWNVVKNLEPMLPVSVVLNVLVLSPLKTVKQNPTFRAKVLRLEAANYILECH